MTSNRNCEPALLSLLLLLLLSQAHPVCAAGDDGEAAGFNLQAYVPARILISYTYTNNFSIADVSSIGKSLYKITSGPTSIEFKAEDIDRYTFTVIIKYAAVVAQSIQIAVFSGNYAPEGIQLNVKDDVVKLKFTLTVTEQPKYPSAQEVAEHVVRQVANELGQFESRTGEIVELQNRNLETQWVLIVFNLVVNIAILLSLMLWIRPKSEGRR